MKKVLITGILGQDGSNMAELLLELNSVSRVREMSSNSKVYGMMRRSGSPNYTNIKNFRDNQDFELVDGDLSDSASIDNLVKEIQPDFLINFGANSFVADSWNVPLSVLDVNTGGVVRCLEAIRKFKPDCRFYSAGSSEEFGDVDYNPQDIKHPVKPRSPYGASKAAARHMVKVYRESYDLYAVHSILFNHEGTRRGEEFVTRKITKKVAEIKHALDNNLSFKPLELGNVNSRRDWSDSKDFMRGVWLMLNQDKPKDYVLSSNETHSVKDFVSKAFAAASVPGLWSGEGMAEKFRLFQGNNVLAEINKKFYRPAEVDILHGDSTPIREELGWEPNISFDKLVESMVENDLAILNRDLL
tara:strand:- start:192 stop:1265 length:1074 start_codon:yes stop_codon:yes gene_type:complete